MLWPTSLAKRAWTKYTPTRIGPNSPKTEVDSRKKKMCQILVLFMKCFVPDFVFWEVNLLFGIRF